MRSTGWCGNGCTAFPLRSARKPTSRPASGPAGLAFAAAFGAAILLMALYHYPQPIRPGISYKWAAYGVPGMAFAFALVAIFAAFTPLRMRGKLWTVIGVLIATLSVLFFLWAAIHFG